MADPKAPGRGMAVFDERLREVERRLRDKEVPSGTQKNLTTEKVLQAIEELQEQQATILAVQAEQAAQQSQIVAVQGQQATLIADIQAQQAYLASLTVSSARSNTGALSVPANAWSTRPEHRPSLTNVRTTTGKLRITVSGTVASAAAVYSIDGQVSRDDLIVSAGILDSLNSNDPNYYMGGSKTFTVTGLPLNTNLTVRGEVRGLSVEGAAARMSIIVEVIP